MNNKLSPLSLGLSLGIIWGLSLFFMGLSAHYWGYGVGFVTAVGSVYFKYAPSLLGSLWGGIIGFIDAFITGVLIAWFYNLIQCCRRGACETVKKNKTRKS